jgi:fibronectin type 3 domain-containing protein
MFEISEALRRLHRAADKAVRRAVVWAPLVAALLGGASFARAASRAYLNINIHVQAVGPVTDLTATAATSSGTINLSWTEPSHTTGSGALSYEVRVSTVGEISNDVDFSTSPLLSVFSPSLPPTPGAGGGSVGFAVSGLTGGVTYYFAIREDSTTIDGSWTRSLAPALNVNNFAIAQSSTPKPNSGSIIAVATTSITAAWGVATGATDYTLVASSVATHPPLVIFASSTTLSSTATVSGLTPNTTFAMLVSACGASCSHYDYLGTTVTLAAPAISLSTTAVSTGAVALAWSANGNPSSTTYLVEVSTDGVSFSTAPPSTTTATVVGGLSALTTFYVEVVAQNFAGVLAAPSNVVKFVTSPAAPAGGAVVSVTTASITAAWTVSAGATDYVLVASTSSALPPSIAASSTTLSSTAAVSGLAPNTSYYLSVSACGFGCSPFAPLASTVTLAAPAISLSTTSVSSGTVGLTWAPNGNPSSTTYLVEVSTNGVAFSTAAASLSTSAAVGSLAGATTYYFEVVAKNFAGVLAAPSNVVQIITPIGRPSAPAAGGVVSVTTASITAAWSISAGATDYVLVASTSSALPAAIAGSSTTLSSTATIAGLAPNTSYFLFVSACDIGCSAYTSISSTFTLAVPAVALSSTSLSSSTISLAWGANGNPAGTTYVIEISTNNVSFSPAATTNATAAQLTGLTGGVTYYLEAVAVNFDGIPTAPSSVLVVVTPVGPVPSTPTGLTAVGGLISASVSWNALPVLQQGQGLAEYRLLRSLSPSSGFVQIATTTGTSYLDKVLAAGVTVYYEIAARDVAGSDSGLSTAAAAVPYTEIPMEPLGLTIVPSSETVSITWTPTSRFFDSTPFLTTGAPNADELQGYSIYRSTNICDPNFVQVSSLTITTTSYTDYTGGLNYFYRLFSFNDAGVSSNVVTFDALGQFNYFLQDCLSTLVLDPQTSASLSGTANGIGDIRIIATQRPQDVGNGTFQSAQWAPFLNGVTPLKNYALPKPGHVVLGYTTSNGSVVQSADMSKKGAEARAVVPAAGPAVSPTDLGVYWNNGQQFVKMYGKVDTAGQTVSVDSPNLGVYQIRAQARSAGAVFDVSNLSSRVITPNGDGLNDTVIFTYDPGPNNVVPTGKIFDLRGASVADMTPGLVPNTLTWNGFMNGLPVHSGVYVYRITGDGKTFTGTIVVAR